MLFYYLTMRYLYILLFFSFISCKTNKASITSLLSNKIVKATCDEKALCTVEVLKNKNYSFDIDSMGKLFPKMIDGENIVIKYTYKLIPPAGVSDAFQSETLHFVINDDIISELKNEDLQKIKLIYGKNCFCKDIQGFYKVKLGTFSINGSEVTIKFTIPEVGDRQLVKTVQFSLN